MFGSPVKVVGNTGEGGGSGWLFTAQMESGVGQENNNFCCFKLMILFKLDFLTLYQLTNAVASFNCLGFFGFFLAGTM